MNTTSKKFITICLGLSMVICSLALLFFSITKTFASEEYEKNKAYITPFQTGTAENFISLGVQGEYAYWIVFNTDEGYKFRKAKINSTKWLEQ